MADLQLKRLEAERDRLQAEFKTLNEAISTREACEDLIKAVERVPDPFSQDGQQPDNPWIASNAAGNGCCVVT